MKKVFKSLLLVSFLVLLLSALSFCISAADLPAPQITDIISDSDYITLTWNQVEGAKGYIVEMKEGKGEFTQVSDTTETSLTLKELPADTSYSFRVCGYTVLEDETQDLGPYSKNRTKKTKLPTVKNIRYSSSTINSITVKWNKVSGATSYNVYYAVSGQSKYTLSGSTEKSSFRIEGLDNQQKYKIKVVAKNASNSSLYSDAAVFYVQASKLKTPVIKSTDINSITISWEKSGRENRYYIYMSTDPKGEFTKIATTSKRTYTYKVNDAVGTFYFRVAPVIETASQLTVGSRSSYVKATVAKLRIEVPSVIRKGDYPDIKVPYYNQSDIKWTSSNKNVITLKNGRLFASGKGTATLTATYKSKYKAQVKVTVSSPVVSVKSAVYDYTNGKYIFEQDINSRCYPASITKLITALTVLEYMDPYDTIVVGSELNMVESNSSTCGLQRGEKFRLKDILYGLLVPSGGDAAYTIAVNCARKVSGNPNMGYVKAKDYFAGLMNKYMKSIGATGTNCVNPHGYPKSNHYSTVHDLMLVANKVLENDLLKTITSTKNVVVTSKTGQRHSWRTTNSLMKSSSGYYHPNAHGMKTGTVNPGYTGIISVATKNGRTIITIVIGCPTYNARYDNTHKLLKAYL